MVRCFLFLIIIFLSFQKVYAQTDIYWSSPEIEQLYKRAREYLSRGAIQQSVTLFRQAVQLSPQTTILHRDLAQALNLAKNYNEAYSTIEPLIKSEQADELSYQIAATALFGKGEKKKARNIIEKGLKAYPSSGILYNQLSKYYELNNDLEYALDALLQGIERDPIYHLNYYDAARIYAGTDRPVWTIIYGEIFSNLERHTTRSLETRKMMLQAYQKLFSAAAISSVPKYGNNITEGEQPTFEAAVLQIFQQLAPVVADGITAENLTKLRARFAMEWRNTFDSKYHFSLFRYHDKLLKEGMFDAYNQWLFGRAENAATFEAWTKFHAQAMQKFEDWTLYNQYKPPSAEFYNTKDLRSLFRNKKRK